MVRSLPSSAHQRRSYLIHGALLWMAEKLKSEQGEHARKLWSGKGKQAFGGTAEAINNERI